MGDVADVDVDGAEENGHRLLQGYFGGSWIAPAAEEAVCFLGGVLRWSSFSSFFFFLFFFSSSSSSLPFFWVAKLNEF